MGPLAVLLISTSSIAHTDAELDSRIAFLEEHLEAPKVHARAWWWGWMSFYAAAIGAQSVRLALVDPEDEDARAQRADFTISIVKTALGVASLLFVPLKAMEGASDMYEIQGETREDKILRLRAGEAALLENAEQAELRHWWVRHALIVALNLAHGLIVWIGYDDPERGMISAGLGIVVGEIIAWTQPWQPLDSRAAYLAR